MFTPKALLVPYDFSLQAEEALQLAIQLAYASHSHIHILHVIQQLNYYEWGIAGLPIVPDNDNFEMARHHANEALHDLKRKLNEAHQNLLFSVAIDTVLSPEEAVLAYAKEHALECIVMGTHGRRGVGRILMGSVAEYVSRHAPCRVILVKC